MMDRCSKNWIPSYMIFIFEIEFMDQILAQCPDVNIIPWAFYFLFYQWSYFQAAHLLKWTYCLWRMDRPAKNFLRGPHQEVALIEADAYGWGLPFVSDAMIVPPELCAS